jgi:hypothetical protein
MADRTGCWLANPERCRYVSMIRQPATPRKRTDWDSVMGQLLSKDQEPFGRNCGIGLLDQRIGIIGPWSVLDDDQELAIGSRKERQRGKAETWETRCEPVFCGVFEIGGTFDTSVFPRNQQVSGSSPLAGSIRLARGRPRHPTAGQNAGSPLECSAESPKRFTTTSSS